jgi:hypothetical protein
VAINKYTQATQQVITAAESVFSVSLTAFPMNAPNDVCSDKSSESNLLEALQLMLVKLAATAATAVTAATSATVFD